MLACLIELVPLAGLSHIAFTTHFLHSATLFLSLHLLTVSKVVSVCCYPSNRRFWPSTSGQNGVQEHHDAVSITTTISSTTFACIIVDNHLVLSLPCAIDILATLRPFGTGLTLVPRFGLVGST